MSALRYDGRLVRIAGLIAVAEYLGLIAWANATGHVFDPQGLRILGSGLRSQMEYSIILLTATALAAVIVDRAQVLRLSGIRDPLTMLANRGYFYERAHEELVRGARSGRPSAIVMIDLDYFKAVNDAHGHAAGDQVLRKFATVLRSTMRASTIVVTGLSSHACNRSRMRSREPTSEISSANSVGTSGIASSRFPSKNSSWARTSKSQHSTITR